MPVAHYFLKCIVGGFPFFAVEQARGAHQGYGDLQGIFVVDVFRLAEPFGRHVLRTHALLHQCVDAQLGDQCLLALAVLEKQAHVVGIIADAAHLHGDAVHPCKENANQREHQKEEFQQVRQPVYGQQGEEGKDGGQQVGKHSTQVVQGGWDIFKRPFGWGKQALASRSGKAETLDA